jgi:hypothetical protein
LQPFRFFFEALVCCSLGAGGDAKPPRFAVSGGAVVGDGGGAPNASAQHHREQKSKINQ